MTFDEAGPLSDEARRILSQIPERIGDTAGDQGASSPDDSGGFSDAEAGEIVALMDGIEFTPDDVAGAVGQFCEQMDKWLDSDVWSLSEGQQRLIGKPYALLANTAWTRVKAKLPGWLSAACDSTPGLAGTILVTAVVFGPKTFQQWTISRARARAGARPTIVPSNNAPESQVIDAVAEAPQPGGSRLRWPTGSGPRQ